MTLVLKKWKKKLTKPEWIIDGNYINNALRRFEECDTVYFLDINRFVCLHSVLKRHRTYKGKYRASRSLYCDEKITKDYLNWVFNQFYKTSRKHILNYLKTHSDKNIVVFKNRRQVNKYLEEVSK